MKKATTVSRSPISPQKTTNKIEGTIRVYPEIQEEKHQIKKGLPGCYIESQATIEKKEKAEQEDKTVRL
jgi:hypothetical protein